MDRIGKLSLLAFATVWLFTASIVIAAVWLVSPGRADASTDANPPLPPAVFDTADQGL